MDITNLKLLGEVDELKEIVNNILDNVYPVGTYYETSNKNFNPNNSFYGTWVEDTEGLVTIGRYKGDDPSFPYVKIAVGTIQGEKEHLLTVDEIPSHEHEQYATANPGTGGTAIRGTFNGEEGDGLSKYAMNAVTASSGNDKPHNNVQPSIGVIRWHRTA